MPTGDFVRPNINYIGKLAFDELRMISLKLIQGGFFYIEILYPIWENKVCKDFISSWLHSKRRKIDVWALKSGSQFLLAWIVNT